VHCLGNPSDELSGCHAAAVRCGNRQLPGLECRYRGLQSVLPILERFLDGIAIGEAVRKIRIGDEKATAFLSRKRANFKRVVNALGQDSCSFNKFQKLPDVDRFDGTPRRNAKRLAVGTNEHAVTRSIMPPVDAMLTGYGLKLPIERVAAHGDQPFCGRIRSYDTAGNITLEAGTGGAPRTDVAKASMASATLFVAGGFMSSADHARGC
jgi:hypothetical protein